MSSLMIGLIVQLLHPRTLLNVQLSERETSTSTCYTYKPRDFDSMLALCWADVEDGSPTSNQHWFNVFSLRGKCTCRLITMIAYIHYPSWLHITTT